jgi:type II secretory pathway pseudopilin PulG
MNSSHTHFSARTRSGLPRRIAFTIIELLVVVTIIIVLVGLLVVAINQASRASQRTSTIALMDSIAKGLERFKGDIGYYPPVLGVPYTTSGQQGMPSPDELRRLYPGSVPNPDVGYTGGSFSDHMQEYYSTCTIADYLLGWDVGLNDGYGYPAQNESPPAGIRHPSTDGVWDATVAPAPPPADGSLAARNPATQGKVWGPYIEVNDDVLAGVVYGPSGLQTYFPGDVLPAGVTWDTVPKAIVDYWGMPIRYYRRPYPPGAIGQSYRAVDRSTPPDGIADPVPTLSDVFVLRPWEIKPGSESPNHLADDDGKTASTRDLDAAEFGLLSAGPDKSVNQRVAVDAVNAPNDQQVNKDNIVKVGP